eukprot:2364767-Alexandrium_andersonii.AAC.1
MGESALTGQLRAPLRGTQSCCAIASSPVVRCQSGCGPQRAPRGLCGGGLASFLGISATSRRSALRLTPM